VVSWIDEPRRNADDRRERLGPSLLAAKRFLDAASVATLFGSLLPAGSEGRALLGAGEVDHVGFLAPRGSEPLIAIEAGRAGFTAGGIAFPSTMLARELAERTGHPVPATVVKRFGHTPWGRRVAVEVFVVAHAEPDLGRWLAEGVGMHVAVDVGERAAFLRALAVLPREGLAMPAFTAGRPHFVTSEGVTLAYFDLGTNGSRLRLEVRAAGDHTGTAQGTTRSGLG
jgi:hypothetical protein